LAPDAYWSRAAGIRFMAGPKNLFFGISAG
jgi:hypothetical protein